MFRKLVGTRNDALLTVLRLVLGIIFFLHGTQKVLGWFGGSSFTATMHVFTATMHIPAVFAFLAICAEFLGGLGLIVGLLARLAAFSIVVEMLVAISLFHYHFGLFMNWSGHQKGEGIEYHLLAIAIGIVIMARGAGALSIDRLLAKK